MELIVIKAGVLVLNIAEILLIVLINSTFIF